MSNITIEMKIEADYKCTVIEFFQDCVDKKMEINEIAKKIKCSVSNLRRIARKYRFNFHQTTKIPMLSENKEFLTRKITIDNFLSRNWI